MSTESKSVCSSPLRVTKMYLHQTEIATQALRIDSSQQEYPFNRNATESAEKHLSLAGLASKGAYSGGTGQDQIVRPSTTHKNSSAKDGVAVYDCIVLNPQLQPLRNVDVTTKHKTPRRLMPHNEGNATPGHRPTPRDSSLASQTLSHTNRCETSLNSPIHLKEHPKFSLCSSPDIQNGPRPPPWGSDDDLALQRRIRSGLRERTHSVAGDAVLTPTSTYQELPSTRRSSEGLSREVQEYRQQILSVYPDMTLDGDAGEERRGWTCCVVI